ncbi:oligosaccharide flippase family protein [Collinsella ihumii]|uniref:Oligosaccharide flippase family protein n=1 Tax=Collinsella ihumii TaxID=1720204 RepID=A0AAW7K1Q7_9ACTN|nr:oligosaccharide flippase family protein [Collinsella ihumii]MDN0069551.1 oligosaccharide flippase family protein [Collinsella ihumii]
MKSVVGSLSRLKDRGAPAVLAGSVLTKAAAFLGSIVLVRVMSKYEYGVLSYMENVYTYVYLLAGLGLNNAVFRYVVLKEGPSEKLSVIRFVLARGAAINIAIVLVGIAFAILFPHAPEFSRAASLLPVMLLALPFQFSYDTFSYSLRALFRNGTYAIVAVEAIALVWTGKVVGTVAAGLDGAVWAGVAAYTAMAAGCLVYFRTVLFPGVEPSPTSRGEAKSYLAYGAQFMVTNGMWAMFLQNDLLLIGMLTGDPSSVADYRVAYAVPSMMAILSSSIGTFVAPYFIRHEGDRRWVWSNYKKVIVVTSLVLGPLCLGIALFSKPFVGFFYGVEYLNAVPLMSLLLVSSFITNGIRYTTANLLSATGKVKANMVIAVCGIAAQLALNLLLIPQFGEYGAAATSIVVYSGMAIAVVVVFKKIYQR